MKNPVVCVYGVLLFFVLALWNGCSWSVSTPPVKVKSMERVVDQDDLSKGICAEFQLSELDVVNYFKMADRVSADVFDEKAIILPCRYQGQLSLDGKLLNWEIVAGGAGYVYDKVKKNERYLCISDACCAAIKRLCR